MHEDSHIGNQLHGSRQVVAAWSWDRCYCSLHWLDHHLHITCHVYVVCASIAIMSAGNVNAYPPVFLGLNSKI